MLPIGTSGQVAVTFGPTSGLAVVSDRSPAELIRPQPVEPVQPSALQGRQRPKFLPRAERGPERAGDDARLTRFGGRSEATAERGGRSARLLPSLPFLAQQFVQDQEHGSAATIGGAPVGNRPVDAYQRTLDRERFFFFDTITPAFAA